MLSNPKRGGKSIDGLGMGFSIRWVKGLLRFRVRFSFESGWDVWVVTEAIEGSLLLNLGAYMGGFNEGVGGRDSTGDFGWAWRGFMAPTLANESDVLTVVGVVLASSRFDRWLFRIGVVCLLEFCLSCCIVPGHGCCDTGLRLD